MNLQCKFSTETWMLLKHFIPDVKSGLQYISGFSNSQKKTFFVVKCSNLSKVCSAVYQRLVGQRTGIVTF